MADISTMTVNSVSYNIKDAVARSLIKTIDLTATTSMTQFNGYYYANVTLPNNIIGKTMIGLQIISSAGNRPAFLFWNEISLGIIRIYSVGANDAVTIRVTYLDD